MSGRGEGEFRKLQGTARQSPPQKPAPARASVPPPRPPRHTGDGDVWWPLRIPRRLWFGIVVVTSPVRALALVLDMAVAACVLALVATGWAWWTGIISDEAVADVLARLGERGLNILGRSGLL